jgi:hypothetical protein
MGDKGVHFLERHPPPGPPGTQTLVFLRAQLTNGFPPPGGRTDCPVALFELHSPSRLKEKVYKPLFDQSRILLIVNPISTLFIQSSRRQ